MKDGLTLKVGDRVVRYGRVLKVFQIKGDTVYFQPHFNPQTSNGLTYQISLKNVTKSNIRKLVTKQKLQDLFKSILNTDSELGAINDLEIRSSLNANNLLQTLKVIKNLWLEKTGRPGTLASGKQNIYQQAMDQATEEVAAVKGLKLDKARQVIISALG